MNRGLFCTLVLLFCIALVLIMGACESRSGRMRDDVTVTVQSPIKPVKIVIVKVVKIVNIRDINTTKMYKVSIVPSDGLSHYMTSSRYIEVGDTIMARPTIDFN